MRRGRVPDVPLDLRRRSPRYHGPGMDTYEAYTSRRTAGSTLHSTTGPGNSPRKAPSIDVCNGEVMATLPVRARGNTARRHFTHVESESRSRSHSSGAACRSPKYIICTACQIDLIRRPRGHLGWVARWSGDESGWLPAIGRSPTPTAVMPVHWRRPRRSFRTRDLGWRLRHESS